MLHRDGIFSGAAKLPPADEDISGLFRIANWWLQCLGEITDHLSGAQWQVHIDDQDLEWSEQAHYLFPVEEIEEL